MFFLFLSRGDVRCVTGFGLVLMFLGPVNCFLDAKMGI